MIKYNFSDKTAIVTGAGSGIGKVTALELAKAGANVVFVSKSEKPQLMNEIINYNEKVKFIKADVSIEEDVIRMVRRTIEEYGSIQILINNAGVSKGNIIENTLSEEWDWVMANNVKSCFLCTKHVVPIMKEHKYGKIINISSIAGRDKSMILGVSYTTSKAAIIGFTRHMGTELAEYNINVNTVCPSQTNTRMLQELMTPEINEMLLNKIPLGYIQEPIQVAKVILFLCADESNYMTGSIVDVNGGLL